MAFHLHPHFDPKSPESYWQADPILLSPSEVWSDDIENLAIEEVKKHFGSDTRGSVSPQRDDGSYAVFACPKLKLTPETLKLREGMRELIAGWRSSGDSGDEESLEKILFGHIQVSPSSSK